MKKNKDLNANSVSIRIIYCIGLLLFSFIACSNKNKTVDTVQNEQNSISILQDSTGRKIVTLSIPSDLVTQQDKNDYIALHYWDNFDFADTTYIHQPKVMGQTLINYIEALSHIDISKADSYMNETLKRTEVNVTMQSYFLKTLKSFLYDPNSPFRNEEYYIPVLKYIIESKSISTTDIERAKFEMNLLLKNRKGNKATDIIYTLLSGNTGTLYDIKGAYTILMFYNPDCHACGEILTYMKQSSVINKALDLKLLSILTFYPDKDLDIWRKHLPDIPNTWINGYDKEQVVERKQLYDLKAIPTLYLLDKNKKVLLKDASIDQIAQYLKNNNLLILGDS